MNYTWDENKLALNLENHKVHFAIAERFDWSTSSIEPDTCINYGEPYGLVENRLHCLVFTPRDDSIRIISLRKANKRKVKRYVIEN